MARNIRVFVGVVIGISTVYVCSILFYVTVGTYGVLAPIDLTSVQHERFRLVQQHSSADDNSHTAAENVQDGAELSHHIHRGRLGTFTRSSVQPAVKLADHHSDGNIRNRVQELQVQLQSGFELAAAVQTLCSAQHLKPTSSKKKLFLSSDKSVLYCPVEKIASTFWKRTLVLLPVLGQEYIDSYDVPIGTALKIYGWLSDVIRRDAVPDDTIRFMFVRNPYSRLFSAFVDKFVAPNPTFWQNIGAKAILMFRNESRIRKLPNAPDVNGSDMTFSELVKYATFSEKTGKNYDVHFSSIFQSCKPCFYNYTFIGRLESFHKDAITVLEQMRINTTVLRFKNKFREMWAEDAIVQIIRTVFSWKEDIIQYITWKEALERIWLKLQLSNIIGYEKKLDLSDERLNALTESEFFEMAQMAHRTSKLADLSVQKRAALRKAFSSVSKEDIEAFKEAYRRDFMLFGYTDALL